MDTRVCIAYILPYSFDACSPHVLLRCGFLYSRTLFLLQVLTITDAIKTSLGLPLDGVTSAVSDVNARRYREVSPPRKPKVGSVVMAMMVMVMMTLMAMAMVM